MLELLVKRRSWSDEDGIIFYAPFLKKLMDNAIVYKK